MNEVVLEPVEVFCAVNMVIMEMTSVKYTIYQYTRATHKPGADDGMNIDLLCVFFSAFLYRINNVLVSFFKRFTIVQRSVRMNIVRLKITQKRFEGKTM